MSVQTVGANSAAFFDQASKNCCIDSIQLLIEKMQGYMSEKGLARIIVRQTFEFEEARIGPASILSCGDICRDITLPNRPALTGTRRYQNVPQLNVLFCPTCSDAVTSVSEVKIDENSLCKELVKKTEEFFNQAIYAMVSAPIDQDPDRDAIKLCLNLFQSLHQLVRNKTVKVVETLKSCHSQSILLGINFGPSVDLLLNRLSQPQPEDLNSLLKKTMKLAQEESDLDDKAFLYTQVIAHAPYWLDAYMKLIPLLPSSQKKSSVLLQLLVESRKLQSFCEGENLHSLNTLIDHYARELEKIINPISISSRNWHFSDMETIPPHLKYEIASFFNRHWLLPKRHTLTPMFPNVILENSPVPRTLDSLDLLVKEAGDVGLRRTASAILKHTQGEGKFHWMVTIESLDPRVRFPEYDNLPSTLDIANMIFWENRLGRKWEFGNFYVRCREKIADKHVIVGNFEPKIIGDSENSVEGNVREGKGLDIKLEEATDQVKTLIWKKIFSSVSSAS
jgi:hypothetical protein